MSVMYVFLILVVVFFSVEMDGVIRSLCSFTWITFLVYLGALLVYLGHFICLLRSFYLFTYVFYLCHFTCLLRSLYLFA